jgi:hypothetical protein
MERKIGELLTVAEIIEYWKNAKGKFRKNPPAEYERRKEPILYPEERRRNLDE